MKFRRAKPDGYEWSLTAREWHLLNRILDLFPLIPPKHHQLSKTRDAPNLVADEAWLQKSMSAHTDELRKALNTLLPPPLPPDSDPQSSSRTGMRVLVHSEDLERLLQVLNNIRVGSWIQLGCPDPEHLPEQGSSLPHFLLAMEYCGWIQGHILQALADPNDPTPG